MARTPNSISSILSDPLIKIVLLFAVTQIIGVGCGLLLLNSATSQPEVNYISVAPTGQSDDWLNGVYFVGYVLLGAVVALFLIRFVRKKFAFRLLEFAMLSGSVSVVFLAIFNGIFGMEFWSAIALGGTCSFAFAALKFFLQGLKNVAAVLSSSGVAALFGFSMGFWPALLFVLGLSLYDYIAVFKTRHMLQMAQSLGDRELSFTVTAEKNEKPTPMHRPAIVSHHSDLDAVHAGRAPSSASSNIRSDNSSSPSSSTPHSNIDRLDLGSGDLAVPAMLAVSASSIAGVWGSVAVAFGSTIAIFFTLRFVIDKRVALPALPPICLGGLSALLIVLILRGFFGF